MNNLFARAKAFWASLPHQLQAILVAFAGGAAIPLGKLIDSALSDPSTACWAWACLKHDAGITLLAGLATARAFYMFPNRNSTN